MRRNTRPGRTKVLRYRKDVETGSGSAGLQPCPTDPFALFRKWFRDAQQAGEPLPEAMALATASRRGRPSVRIVLNRGVSRGGFVFYTNYKSRKAGDLDSNP